jgi:hypothetical protein
MLGVCSAFREVGTGDALLCLVVKRTGGRHVGRFYCLREICVGYEGFHSLLISYFLVDRMFCLHVLAQEEAFGRPPSSFEIEYARTHGWAGLEERTLTGRGPAGASPGTGGKRRGHSEEEESSARTSSSGATEDGSDGAATNSDNDDSSSPGSEGDCGSESGG